MLSDRDAGSVAAGDTLTRLLDGELRKALGLSREELRVGLKVARNHMTRGAPLEALRIYAALVLCDPMEVDFQVGLANCASQVGEHPVALQAASAVIALAPSDPRGYLLSGRSCMMMGCFEEAKEDLEDAVRHARAAGEEVMTKEAEQLLEKLSALLAS